MTISPKLRFLLVAPLIVLPFLCLIFHVLGGGRGDTKDNTNNIMGLNTQLPGSMVKAGKVPIDKMNAYLAADQDSMRKKQSQQSDPYHPYIVAKKDSIHKVKADNTGAKADELLQQLSRLQQSMRQPAPPPMTSSVAPMPTIRMPIPVLPARHADTAAADPQLDRLNTMLDKVIRIQHPGESKQAVVNASNENSEEVLPADSAANAIAAVIPSDQTVVTGGTLSLRLSEDVAVHGLSIPRGQWVYGTVTINNDRMLVHIRTLYFGRNLYNTDLQVYDLDGLPGIHIPDMLSQDVAKQSADESVNGLNVTTYDPSLGAQAANAGIQTAKAFLGRKVRLVRVSVKAGYEVLLRNTRMNIARPAHARVPMHDSVFLRSENKIQPPGFVPGGSFIRRCRTEGMELGLQGIYLQDSLLWFALRLSNHSPIQYVPDYYRWVIRDKRAFKRTAEQELPVEPMCSRDSAGIQWVGFRPFTLPKDKELILEVGERNGGRTLELVIGHQQILHAKIL